MTKTKTSDPDLDRLKRHPSVLRLYASRVPLQKKGKDYLGKCPFHAEKTGSFTVSLGANGQYLFHCFGCAEGGDILRFVQKMDNSDFPAALATVKTFVGDTSRVDAVFKPLADARTYKTFKLSEYARMEDALASSKEGQAWLQEVRGISYETAKRLHLGYRQDLRKYAGAGNAQIAAAGWIAFPCIEGDLVTSIKYRSIARKAFARQPEMATKLFNLETVDALSTVWLCEGEIDALTLEQAGFRAVSLPSASFVLTPEMRDAVLEAELVILAGDEDGGVGIKAMDRLKKDMGDRALKITWPAPHKDANDVFLKECKSDIAAFRELCLNLVTTAKAQPMKGIYSLTEVMLKSKQGVMADHPQRLHFPWAGVDRMANVLPGDIALLTATDSGQGKTIWTMNTTLFGAMEHNEVVLNYQCEMSPEEIANIAAAYVLSHDRNTIEHEQYVQAARLLGPLRYYIGADPTLTSSDAVLTLIEDAIKRFGVTIAVLDHIHFICRSQDEIQEQAAAMQRIKNMAREYGVKFIVLAQPRKSDQKTKGKERHLSDVKGSETLISDSSAVFFLHREVVKNIDPANPPMDDYQPETEIRNKKARSKGTGAAYTKLYFHGNIATFREMTVMALPNEPDFEETIDNFDLV